MESSFAQLSSQSSWGRCSSPLLVPLHPLVSRVHSKASARQMRPQPTGRRLWLAVQLAGYLAGRELSQLMLRLQGALGQRHEFSRARCVCAQTESVPQTPALRTPIQHDDAGSLLAYASLRCSGVFKHCLSLQAALLLLQRPFTAAGNTVHSIYMHSLAAGLCQQQAEQ